MIRQKTSFSEFYVQVFLPEHQRPANVALHTLGTILGLAYVASVLLWASPWFILAFPAVHAAPGLLGHRLFERNLAVGDVRITRKDYSPLWFILANHKMAFERLFKGMYWRAPGA
jgi:hypothetical protein